MSCSNAIRNRVLVISPGFTSSIGGIEAHINALVDLDLCDRLLVFNNGKFYNNKDRTRISVRAAKDIAKSYYTIWSHDPRISLRMRWFFPKHRLFNSSHGFVFHNSKSLFRRAYVHIKLMFARLLLIQVLCVSRSDHDFAARHGAAYLPNFCRFEAIPLLMKDFEKRGGIICVGRYSPHKRIDKVARFAQTLGQSMPFTVVCPSQDIAAYQEHLDASFLSDLDDQALQAAYSSARFFISLSDFEGFGLAAIEAVALGCIPILSRNDAYTAFRDNGLFALFEDNPEKVHELSNDNHAAFEIAQRNLNVFEEYQISHFKKCLKQLHVH